MLSVGLVLFTTAVIGLVVHLLIPELPLAAAFALGAIVAPPDAVAAVAVARRLGLPRRVITILVGESLFNDATALTAYRVAIAAAVGQGISWLGRRPASSPYAAAGGVVIGLGLGLGAEPGCCSGCATRWSRTRAADHPVRAPTWRRRACTPPA